MELKKIKILFNNRNIRENTRIVVIMNENAKKFQLKSFFFKFRKKMLKDGKPSIFLWCSLCHFSLEM